MANRVTVSCPNCKRSVEVVMPQQMNGRSFRCSVCKTIGVVQTKAPVETPPSKPVPPDDYVCATCAVELTPTTLRQIDGQTYCVECASKAEKNQKRFAGKSWNDFKGPTSWGKH